MKKAAALALALGAAPLFGGCIVTDVAGAAVGLTVMTVGAVGGAAIDLVTTDEDEQQSHDIERLKRENEELRKQQQSQATPPK
jgi:hypothetical protein